MSTAAQPVSLSAARWGEAISKALMPFEVLAASPSGIDGRLVVRKSNGVSIVEIESGPHRAARPGFDRAAPPACVLALQVQGTASMDFGGTPFVMRPGDVGIYSTQSRCTFRTDDDYRGIAVQFSPAAVAVPGLDVLARDGLTIPADQGLVPALAGLLVSLSDSLDTIATAARPRAIGGLLNLVGSVLIDEISDPMEPARGSVPVLHRLHRYIDDHLGEPDLDVASIARAHFVSTRYVHAVFQDSGETAAGRIRGRRIEGACRTLADPAFSTVPVARIASWWGFTSASHFGRIFREAVGMTPAMFRSSALAD
ncbi:AraC family transcriptional regulator [Rhodococcus sp. NCIMB 12038]|uniref:AraC family transcriptional regulator n=1 Tax=Rhodococcus sp. NCIMB 12038 TaxID=933800 RepID=UPI0015C62165|nr:AraC family transcriptional regulator [Rhodococcus sp. NCIMB 12038]